MPQGDRCIRASSSGLANPAMVGEALHEEQRRPNVHRVCGIEHANHVAHVINHQRRRSLGYHSPAALYAAPTVQ